MTEMSFATFDTLAAVRNLEKAGMGTSQAEAVTETIRAAVFQGVATKEDLDEVRNELGDVRNEFRNELGEVRKELREVREELKGDIAELRVDFEKLRGEVKEEIAGLRGEVKEDIAGLRGEVKEDIAKMGATLMWRLLGGVSVLLSVFLGLSLYIVRATGGG